VPRDRLTETLYDARSHECKKLTSERGDNSSAFVPGSSDYLVDSWGQVEVAAVDTIAHRAPRLDHGRNGTQAACD
jgi:hypothetical protein